MDKWYDVNSSVCQQPGVVPCLEGVHPGEPDQGLTIGKPKNTKSILLDFSCCWIRRKKISPAIASAGRIPIYQRRRLGWPIRRLGLVGKNAMMLMRLGQLAKSKADPELMKEAEELIYAALRLRVNSLLVQPYLGLKWLFPGWTMSVPTFALPYEELLSCLTRVRQHRSWAMGVLTLS